MTDYMPNAYYDALAEGYDDSYFRDDDDLQSDLAMIGAVIEQNLLGADVLEIASGTGFWSNVAAKVANSVVGVERSEEMLREARAAQKSTKIEFRQGDAWDLQAQSGDFHALLAGFWFSHVPKARIPEFLKIVGERIGPGGVVILMDSLGGNAYKTPLHPIPESQGDTFAKRDMGDAGEFEVLKNCYSAPEVDEHLRESSYVEDLKVVEGTYFWVASYLIPGDNDFDDDDEEGFQY